MKKGDKLLFNYYNKKTLHFSALCVNIHSALTIGALFFAPKTNWLLPTFKGGVTMPNIKSAKKRVLVSAANYERNKAYRSGLRTAIKKANAAIDSGAADMDVAVKVAVKKIDQATAKGILHKNTAGRKKSALVNSLNKAKA